MPYTTPDKPPNSGPDTRYCRPLDSRLATTNSTASRARPSIHSIWLPRNHNITELKMMWVQLKCRKSGVISRHTWPLARDADSASRRPASELNTSQLNGRGSNIMMVDARAFSWEVFSSLAGWPGIHKHQVCRQGILAHAGKPHHHHRDHYGCDHKRGVARRGLPAAVRGNRVRPFVIHLLSPSQRATLSSLVG